MEELVFVALELCDGAPSGGEVEAEVPEPVPELDRTNVVIELSRGAPFAVEEGDEPVPVNVSFQSCQMNLVLRLLRDVRLVALDDAEKLELGVVAVVVLCKTPEEVAELLPPPDVVVAKVVEVEASVDIPLV